MIKNVLCTTAVSRNYKIKPLKVLLFRLYWLAFYLFSGCGVGQPDSESLDETDFSTNFPPCFSIKACLHFIDLHRSFGCRIVSCITYDKKIHFIVQTSFGIEIIRGVIDKKGITLVDRFSRVVYQSDYNDIAKAYHFPVNYLLIQSLVLALPFTSIEASGVEPACTNISYTYDPLTRRVAAVKLIDKKGKNYISLLYQYNMVENHPLCAGIKIAFAINHIGKSYKGRIILNKFHFKKLKKSNISH